jgi:ATP-dependent Lon protease
MSPFDEFTKGMNESPQRISVITDFEGDEEHLFDNDIDGRTLPILPLRDMVLFPGIVCPVAIGRPSSMKLIKEAMKNNEIIGTVCQLDSETEKPEFEDLYTFGTAARIIRVFELGDKTSTVILQGTNRFELLNASRKTPDGYLRGEVSVAHENFPEKNDKEYEILIDTCKDLAIKLTQIENVQNDSAFAIRNITNKMFLVNFLCVNFPLSVEDKMELLHEDSLRNRTFRLITLLRKEIQYAELKANIQMRTKEDIDQQQRQYFLQQQMKNIQDELGVGGGAKETSEELSNRASSKDWGEQAEKVLPIFGKELSKLERMVETAPDYSIQLQYLETILDLPWTLTSEEVAKADISIKKAERVLNKDHYGLEKVKDVVLDYLSVMKLNRESQPPILCFYGPPGVGKTSLCKSIADALGRKYVRMSLGGLHDESEIRGHRRTYIGAMPGRIIKGMLEAESMCPVFVLDEIDKVSHQAFNGDPSAALLEVLDPEQNKAFHDNFLEIPYDLSNVLFIATANDLSTVPAPLLDRMELVEVSGYVTEEKIEIAKRHLIPRALKKTGLDKYPEIKIPKKTIETLVESYTHESGVRELEKRIKKVFSKVARTYASATPKELEEQYVTEIQPTDLKGYLGVPTYSRDRYQGNEFAGVVTGLAWTPAGGEILFIETSLSKGKGGKLTLTGNLGDVMKESAMLALEYIKAHSELLGLNYDIFDHWNIHIHVPEGAIPKDGPSAGITMATSLASALTQRKVRPFLAMSGEITLRGKVLPVGGIKEKLLAAKRAGIKEIILCHENRKDVEEIPEEYLKGVTFHFVRTVKEVFDLALTDEKVADAIQL